MPRTLQPCGTTAAYRRHLRADEKPCGPCLKANAAAKRNEARPPLGSVAEPPPVPEWHESPGSTPGDLEALDELVAALGERSAKADLELARDLLMAAMLKTYKADPTRLPPIVRELRDTWKALGAKPGEEGGEDEDEFTRALRAREAGRAAGA